MRGAHSWLMNGRIAIDVGMPETIIIANDGNDRTIWNAYDIKRNSLFQSINIKFPLIYCRINIVGTKYTVAGNHPGFFRVERIELDAASPVDRMTVDPWTTVLLQVKAASN